MDDDEGFQTADEEESEEALPPPPPADDELTHPKAPPKIPAADGDAPNPPGPSEKEDDVDGEHHGPPPREDDPESELAPAADSAPAKTAGETATEPSGKVHATAAAVATRPHPDQP